MNEKNIPLLFVQKYNIFTFMNDNKLINFNDVYDDSVDVDDIEFYIFEKLQKISNIDLSSVDTENIDLELLFDNTEIDENIIDICLEFVDYISNKNIVNVDEIIKNISNENSELFS